jgi:hypothetical protein
MKRVQWHCAKWKKLVWKGYLLHSSNVLKKEETILMINRSAFDTGWSWGLTVTTQRICLNSSVVTEQFCMLILVKDTYNYAAWVAEDF